MYTKEEVISTYRSLGSIQATAKHIGIGPQGVRRVLIESGDYATERSVEINRRREADESITTIAQALGLKPKLVPGFCRTGRGHIHSEKSLRTPGKLQNAEKRKNQP